MQIIGGMGWGPRRREPQPPKPFIAFGLPDLMLHKPHYEHLCFSSTSSLRGRGCDCTPSMLVGWWFAILPPCPIFCFTSSAIFRSFLISPPSYACLIPRCCSTSPPRGGGVPLWTPKRHQYVDAVFLGVRIPTHVQLLLSRRTPVPCHLDRGYTKGLKRSCV